MIRFTLCLLTAASLFALDLKEIQSEPNLERRARLDLEYADDAFQAAKAAYAAEDLLKAQRELQHMQAGVEAAHAALEATGKDARRHTRPFKLAETMTHDLLRKLEGLANSMDFEDRKIIEGPKAKVQEIHDQWLDEIIMGKR
jgi:hypothetical protein